MSAHELLVTSTRYAPRAAACQLAGAARPARCRHRVGTGGWRDAAGGWNVSSSAGAGSAVARYA